MRGITYFTTLALFASVALPDAANAVILNGGFEEGFGSWQTLGDYRIENSAFGSGTVQGNSQAFLSTAYREVIGFDDNSIEIFGGDAAPVAFISGFAEESSLEGFLGFSTFLGDKSLYDIATAEPIEGSAIKQTFRAGSGQVLSFSWNFLTNESVGEAAVDDLTYPDFNDFAFVSLKSDSGTQLFTLADTISEFQSSSTSLANETGFKTFSYKIPTSGEYTLGIGVVDAGEATRISALLIDKAQVVPETTPTLGMLLFGALGTVSMLKRGKKKRDFVS